MAQRHEWFRDGARAFRLAQRLAGKEHYLPPDEDLYACPLCLQVIFRIGALDSGDLTIEHAPPEKLGGKKLALTCRWCNSGSGSKFDAEAVKERRFYEFIGGQSGQGLRARLTVDGASTRGNMYLSGNSGVLFTGLPRANNPAEVDRLETAMKARSQPTEDGFSWEFQLEPIPFN